MEDVSTYLPTYLHWIAESSTPLVRPACDGMGCCLFVVTNTSKKTVAPPQLSKEQIAVLEAEANTTIKNFAATAVVLYICKQALSCSAHQLITRPPSPSYNECTHTHVRSNTVAPRSPFCRQCGIELLLGEPAIDRQIDRLMTRHTSHNTADNDETGRLACRNR